MKARESKEDAAVPGTAELARAALADFHVHSTFSDGAGTVEDNVRTAEQRGLTHLCCVDHVRRETPWVPAFGTAVRDVAATTPVLLLAGVEAKILDTSGRLDLPVHLPGVDLVFAADHQVPTPAGPAAPRTVRSEIAAGRLRPPTVVDWIVTATLQAMRRYPGVVLAHLFSVLPKIGVAAETVPDATIERLALAARDEGALLEINERWRCPDARTAGVFALAGVPIILGTDSHGPEAIGRYAYALETYAALASRDAAT